ncbi:Rap1a/Tai family immunity protein [Cereibacter changlensis]|uniref:Rap1a/Tai family immunity protein n=1 Tax=Cereibacter changlensis TaxID=402884 RepID=UPI004033787F
MGMIEYARNGIASFAAATTLLMTTVHPSQADEWSTEGILPGCELQLSEAGKPLEGSANDLLERMSCISLMRGAHTAMASACWHWRKTRTGPPPVFSMSPETTFNASIQSFVNWARDHPEHWGRDAATGMVAAIRETFPCE